MISTSSLSILSIVEATTVNAVAKSVLEFHRSARELKTSGNFPTMASIAGWEEEFNKPVVTTNQAALWAVRQRLGSGDRFPGLGRLLE